MVAIGIAALSIDSAVIQVLGLLFAVAVIFALPSLASEGAHDASVR
jgi:hypothetical protein